MIDIHCAFSRYAIGFSRAVKRRRQGGLVGELPRLGLAPPLVFVRQCGPFFPNVGSEFAPSLLKGIRGQPSNFLRPNANRTNDTFAEREKYGKSFYEFIIMRTVLIPNHQIPRAMLWRVIKFVMKMKFP